MNHSSSQFGFALLYSVLVVGAMMSLVFGVLNIVYKQIALSGTNQNSTAAFYSAESGLECGRYWSAYGAFNPSNPSATSSNSFSTIECLGSPIGGSSCSGSGNNTSCGLVNDGYSNTNVTVQGITNPAAAITDTTYPFYNNYFTYSLGPAYNNIAAAPKTTVNIWQTEEYSPSNDPKDLTTAILAAGENGSASNAVQRGAGEIAGITQCLAPAFTYFLTGGGNYPGWTNTSEFAQTIAPYFPGDSVSSLETSLAGTLGKSKIGGSFPYLAGGPADSWSFNPVTNPAAQTSISANFLYISSTDQPNTYRFGYYVENTSGATGVNIATSTFITLATSTAGVVTAAPQNISAALGNNNNIHFGLEEINSSNKIINFWSTYQSDNYSSDGYSDGYSHDVVVATPIPGIVGTNPNSPFTRLSGKYIFGFGGIDGNSPSTYSSVIVALQLAGCP